MSAYGLPLGGALPARNAGIALAASLTVNDITYPPSSNISWTSRSYMDESHFRHDFVRNPDVVTIINPGRYLINMEVESAASANWRDTVTEYRRTFGGFDTGYQTFWRYDGASLGFTLCYDARKIIKFDTPEVNLQFRQYQDSSGNRAMLFRLQIQEW